MKSKRGEMFSFSLLQVDIYAGSVFLYEAVGWNVYLSAACILAITAVYTVLGNYKSTGIQLEVNKKSLSRRQTQRALRS